MRSTSRLSLLSLAASALTTAAMASHAGAALVYDYAAGAATYTAVAGQTVSVPLYLVETVTPGSTSLLASEDGLDSAGLEISRTVGAAAITSLTTNPSFSGLAVSSVAAGATSFTESVNTTTATTGVAPISLGNGVSEVLLGDLQITADALPTTFTVSAYVNGNGTTGGNTLTFENFDDLDTTSLAPTYLAALPGTFTVSPAVVATPEPACLSLLGLGGVTLIARRRRV